MEVKQTQIPGIVIIEPRLFKDDRGYFLNRFLNVILTLRFVKFTLYKITKANQAMVYSAGFTFKTALRSKQTSTSH